MLTSFTLCFLFLSAVVSVSLAEPLYIEGVLVKGPTSIENPPFDCTNKYGTFCDSDCSTLLTCDGDRMPVRYESCEMKSLDSPYCGNGDTSCSSVESLECASEIPDFVCFSEGFFPDVYNCSQYYQCSERSQPYQIFACPSGYLYNSKTTNCIRSNYCQNVECIPNEDQYVIYEADPSFYIFCTTERYGKAFARVSKCQTPGTVFVLSEAVCRFECEAEGRFADPDDPTKFFECSFNKLHQACLTGYEFNADLKYCEKRVDL